MINLPKVEDIIAAADKPPIAGVSVMAAHINALSVDDRRDLAGIVYFGNGEYVTYHTAYQEAQKVLNDPDTMADDLLTLMGPQGLARDLRAGLALLREDQA